MPLSQQAFQLALRDGGTRQEVAVGLLSLDLGLRLQFRPGLGLNQLYALGYGVVDIFLFFNLAAQQGLDFFLILLLGGQVSVGAPVEFLKGLQSAYLLVVRPGLGYLFLIVREDVADALGLLADIDQVSHQGGDPGDEEPDAEGCQHPFRRRGHARHGQLDATGRAGPQVAALQGGGPLLGQAGGLDGLLLGGFGALQGGLGFLQAVVGGQTVLVGGIVEGGLRQLQALLGLKALFRGQQLLLLGLLVGGNGAGDGFVHLLGVACHGCQHLQPHHRGDEGDEAGHAVADVLEETVRQLDDALVEPLRAAAVDKPGERVLQAVDAGLQVVRADIGH